ncbi:RelA/SpoT domain-containing protein [Rubinisphaera sp.]|uniref:GTP pyrophosphokinase n=1 Tax=Rubinisphaera sp. TaxID=2024857 RepID=UPI000C0FC646|nr:RelA/SpoT domain-containing protein [Rubinisphaera sp.]MBV09147.1 hypothetical protein [Rubinisphaera sp.]|tara:strand:+ start:4605 stop:5741 length:1137 start_codon:yes stop_codon:yes gene_type:complete
MRKGTGKKKQCAAITKGGSRCKNNASNNSEFCALHHSEYDNTSLRVEYDLLLPIASRFSQTIEDQVLKLMSSNYLTLGVPIERRVKQWSSIAEKLERKKIQIDRVRQLDDLVGLRLILLFQRDMQGMHKIIDDNFRILSHEDTASRLVESQFGYQSVHYIIGLPQSWLQVPTMKEFGDLKAELQVRTLSQHIWAAASHKLQYKREASVPLPLRRSIHRISAILEVVDLEFERLLKDRDSYVEELKTAIDNRDLNVDVIRKILSSKWPSANSEDTPSDYSELIEDLATFDITTTHQLESLIDNHYDAVMAKERKAVARVQEQLETTGEVWGTSEERTNLGVFYTFTGLTRSAIECKSPHDWNEYANTRLTREFNPEQDD